MSGPHGHTVDHQRLEVEFASPLEQAEPVGLESVPSSTQPTVSKYGIPGTWPLAIRLDGMCETSILMPPSPAVGRLPRFRTRWIGADARPVTRREAGMRTMFIFRLWLTPVVLLLGSSAVADSGARP